MPISSRLTSSADFRRRNLFSSSALSTAATTASSSILPSTTKRLLTATSSGPSSTTGRLLQDRTAQKSAPEPPKKLTRRERKRQKWIQIQEEKAKGNPKRKYYGHWDTLPDLILEQIFQYLPLRSKMSAARVCYHWSRILHCRSIWQNFIVNDYFMTKQRFNFAGQFYEDVLNPIHASNVMNKLIPKTKRLWFLPKKNLHVVCSFERMLMQWCKFHGDLANIESFTYIFPCDFARKHNEIDIYGTGGSILEEMKVLLLHLTGLKRLELNDLELENNDASHVLDEVSGACDVRIRTLKIVNISRKPFQMLAVASFINIRNLYISPHNIGPDLVMCFGDMSKLRNVILMVNAFTDCQALPVDSRIWKLCRKNNPHLRVHLVTEGKKCKEVVFQEGAPVKSIVYDSAYVKTSGFTIYTAVDLYKTDLECVAYCRLPRYPTPKHFHDRGDGPFLHLVKECPYIHTLMIRERVSSATILLLAYSGKNLRYFHVRRNAIMLKCDWPKNPNWESSFYNWLKTNSRSYEAMEREVSNMLGFRWYALNDKQFKLTYINLTQAYYFDGYEDLTAIE